MTKRVFRAIFLASIAILLTAAGLIAALLYSRYEKDRQNELKSELNYIAAGVEQSGTKYLSALETDVRITLIDSDGTVEFDNKVDPAAMGNHAAREEVIGAKASGEGMSIRYSQTLTRKTVNRTRLLSDGRVLRVSVEVSALMSYAAGMITVIAALVIFSAAVSFVIAYTASKSIVRPINELNVLHPESSTLSLYPEMKPLLNRIAAQNAQLEEQFRVLSIQRDEFKTITDNMSEGIVVLDKNSAVLSKNAASAILFDANSDSFIDNTALKRLIHSALSGKGKSCGEATLNIGTRTYSVFWGSVFDRLNAENDKNELPVGAVLITLDVTEREKREALRREFAANVSHELKTPLTSVMGIAEIIKSGIVEQSDIAHFASNIYAEASRLLSLIDDTIRLSGLDEGADSLAREKTDVYLTTLSVRDRLKGIAEKSSVSLTVEGQSAIIYGVPRLIDEIIYNLSENAVKYNKPHGSVTISVTENAEAVTLCVKDTGLGIPDDDKDRVFERFYRVDKSRSKDISGTGLGLSIVKHASAAHNAEITLLTKLGEGTTVFVRFPISQTDTAG